MSPTSTLRRRLVAATRLVAPVAALLLALGAPALARAAGDPAAAPAPVSGGPTLALTAGLGSGSDVLAAHLRLRYTFWASPHLGVGLEGFTAVNGFPMVGSVSQTGADLGVSLRHPGRVVDLIVRGSAGAARYESVPGTGLAYDPTVTPTFGTGLATSAALLGVFHLGRRVGLLVGGRVDLLTARGKAQSLGFTTEVGLAVTPPA